MADFSLLKNTAGLVLLSLLLSPTLLLKTASAQVGAEKISIQPSGKITEVVERDGNIYSIDRSGRAIRLTSSGVDFEPSLSTDQKWATFVRENSEVMRGDHAERDFYPVRSIWIVAADGSDTPRSVLRHDSGKPLCGLFKKPTFSNNNSKIYFLDQCWVTSDALFVVNLQDSSTQLLTGANSLDIVRIGKWANHLIVQKHKYFHGGGSYDWYWLVSSDGRQVGPLDWRKSLEIYGTGLLRFVRILFLFTGCAGETVHDGSNHRMEFPFCRKVRGRKN